MKHLPLLPAPFLDETFGSWFARAATSYHTDARGLAGAILSIGGEKLPRQLDLDTNPPEALLIALTRHSGLHRSDLDRLIVPPTGSTLPLRHRDAYCGSCLVEDRLLGVENVRRAWLDAWTLLCEKHRCVLGRFEPIEYREKSAHSVKNFFPGPRESLRRNPSVVPVRLPRICTDDGTHARRWTSVLRDMLSSAFGRDLMLFVGSAAADALFYELTGVARLWHHVWHDAERAPLFLPAVEQPMGSIGTRVIAAFVSSYLWENLFTDSLGTGAVRDMLLKLWRRPEKDLVSCRSRWSRVHRDMVVGDTHGL